MHHTANSHTGKSFTFDSDQLPELPDAGPRDGRHGVDRDEEFDPYPARRKGAGAAQGPLTVSLDEAKRHLPALIARVQAGEEIVLTRHGRPAARIVAADATIRVTETVIKETVVDAGGTEPPRVARASVQTRTKVYDHDDQMPELPDPGPRDGRHGVDRDRGYKPFGRDRG
jgi:prevent-host-death family protein